MSSYFRDTTLALRPGDEKIWRLLAVGFPPGVVLSFTTSVGVVVERGVAVYRAAARDAGAVELV